MIKTLTLITCATLFVASVSAQKIKVKQESENLGGGSNPALTVVIYETDEKTVEKEWKSFMKKYDAKVSNSGGEIFADNAMIKAISPNTLDIYAKTKKEDNGTRLYVAVNMGGAFMSPGQHSSETKTMEKMLEDFARDLAKESVAAQLKEAEKEQEKLEKKQEQLVKQNGNLHDDIEKYKEKIKKAEEETSENLKNQEESKKAIETHKKIVDEIKIKASKID